MATGDDALAAGMAIMTGAEAAHTLDTEMNKTRDYIAQRTAEVTSVTKGGTGATNAAAARANLGINAANTPTTGSNVQTELNALNGAMANIYPKGIIDGVVGTLENNANSRVSKSGDTMSGPLHLLAAAPVTSSYAVMYRQASDGRVGVTPSARKYKRDIEDYDGTVLGLRPVTYILNDDENAERRLGIIADDADDVEPLLVIRADGEVESFRYELLAVGLLREVQRLADRVRELEAGGDA